MILSHGVTVKTQAMFFYGLSHKSTLKSLKGLKRFFHGPNGLQ